MYSIQQLNDTAAAFGSEPLLICFGGETVNVEQGYIPLHVNFTVEDKAAKGLRKRKDGDKIEPPVYFSAFDIVKECRYLLLQGVNGSGKTTFAKHLAFSLATKSDGVGFDVTPCYFDIDDTEGFRTFLRHEIPKLIKHFQATNTALILIIDSVENLRDEASLVLNELIECVNSEEDIKVLLLGDLTITTKWTSPSEIIRHELRPLSEPQRRHGVKNLTECDSSQDLPGLGTAAGTPINFALALEANSSGETNEDLLDAWLATVAPETDNSHELLSRAYYLCSGKSVDHSSSTSLSLPRKFSSKAVQRLLAARHLVDLPPHAAIDLFQSSPSDSEPTLRSLIARLDTINREHLLQGLLNGSKTQVQMGALLVADFLPDKGELRNKISSQMLDIVEEASLHITHREKAGRILSQLGDPRDLTNLASIPEGEFTLGSTDHPNSQPVTLILVEDFRIGIYPVINRDYSLFIKDTGREWHSSDGFNSETQNSPATDLSWYDARAYCEWLTHRWQTMGRIARDEIVRLPTEPEWERAARGDQRADRDGQIIYPWGTEWNHGAINYEETGFNKRVSVGLFPAGTSPYGCHDMAGQIWEWCSTLWGEDMATPTFRYPWRSDDGREDPNAPGKIRRVLRGGCFSSGKAKASCTYRGSLEPGGFWRGNGFRVVVAPIGSQVS